MNHINPGRGLERFARQVAGRTHAAAAECKLARVLLAIRDQFFDGVDPQPWVDRHHERHEADHANRGEILDRIVGQVGIETRVGPMRGAVSHQERIAVGRRFCHVARAYDSIGSRLVVDHDADIQIAAHLLGHQTRQVVVGPACREGRNRLDRLIRKSRLCGRNRASQQEYNRQGAARDM